jgi:putative glutamine amidotransferase
LHPFHCVGEKYIEAIARAADAIPLLIPALDTLIPVDEVLEDLDGLLLTGSASNVEPHRYSGPASDPGTLHDPHRDALTLPMIPQAVESGVPVLGVCRGFQEMNVAYGGTLWQKLHEVPGLTDHRENKDEPLEVQYGPAHEVELVADGVLRRLAGRDRVEVNSVHWQGVRELGPALAVEAKAPDGLVEAFRVRDARSFALAVQWHPEWQVMSNPFSQALFAAFGAAARGRAQGRRT